MGLDFKTGLPLLGFRAEVRDFLTGVPTFNSGFLTQTGLHHHNILAGGGIVLRFWRAAFISSHPMARPHLGSAKRLLLLRNALRALFFATKSPGLSPVSEGIQNP